jgi:mycofactocin precursor
MRTRQPEPPITNNGSPRAVAVPAPSSETSVAKGAEAEAEVVLEELLVEDVSIDGMCGVY